MPSNKAFVVAQSALSNISVGPGGLIGLQYVVLAPDDSVVRTVTVGYNVHYSDTAEDVEGGIAAAVRDDSADADLEVIILARAKRF